MSEILFVTWDGGGNVPPALSLARELVRRGHGVRFLGHPTQREPLTAAGFAVAGNRHARPFSSVSDHSTRDMLAAFADRGLGRDLLEEVAAHRPDLLVVDCLLFGALEAAHVSGTPYVVLEHLYDGYYEDGCLRGPLALLVRARGLHARRAVHGARARLVLAHPDLDPAPRRGRSPSVRHVGPVVPPRRPGDPSSGGVVVVSLSTFAFRGMGQCLQRMIDATAMVDADVVVTTGPAVDPASLRAPERVQVHRYVAHAALMPRATAFVGHGGHGSTMQALAHDLPVVLMPQDPKTDQPRVARSVAEAGAGVVLDRRADSARIGAALATVLDEGPHRTAAARLGAAVRAMPGDVLGADVVEELVSRQGRGTPSADR